MPRAQKEQATTENPPRTLTRSGGNVARQEKLKPQPAKVLQAGKAKMSEMGPDVILEIKSQPDRPTQRA
jgi:hypothetical protein